MKQKLVFLVLLLCAALSLAACGETPGRDTPPQDDLAAEANEPESTAETGELRVTYTEDDLPENTPEHQEYLEKYIIPYGVTGIFRRSFGPGDLSALDDRLMTVFNAFYLRDYPDSELQLTDMQTDVPQDVLEGVLMSHLNLTPEQIRAACAEYYDAQKQVYTYSFGLGGGPSAFVVTASSLDSDILSLYYDFYIADDQNPTDTFRYMLAEQGCLQIRVDGEAFVFVSNAVQKAPGVD